MTDISAFIVRRDALFRNPTLEAATAHYAVVVGQGWPSPLAMAHKSRLKWLEATDAMLAESRAWLKENGYEATVRGAPGLTPATRDLQRIRRGLRPLGIAKRATAEQ